MVAPQTSLPSPLLSRSKFLSDQWMHEKGFLSPEAHLDLKPWYVAPTPGLQPQSCGK